LRQLWPRSITLAVPVGAQGVIRCLRPEVDNILVLISTEQPETGLGWGRRLGPVDLRQVLQLLQPPLGGSAGDAPQSGSRDVSPGSSTSG
jgi:hypothetical protein